MSCLFLQSFSNTKFIAESVKESLCDMPGQDAHHNETHRVRTRIVLIQFQTLHCVVIRTEKNINQGRINMAM